MGKVLTNKNKLHMRKPNLNIPPDFNWKIYLELNPDVRRNGFVNEKLACEHYEKWGAREGRLYTKTKIEPEIIEIDSLETEPIIDEAITEENTTQTFNSEIKFSVAPIYKRELTVVIPNKVGQSPEVTINSLYKQTFKNFDIIIINDTEGNANKARNIGLKQVTTPFVLFSDNDIEWKPTAIFDLYDCLKRNPDVSISYGAYEMGNNVISNVKWDDKKLKKVNYISTMSMVRTEDHPGFDESIKRFQDWDVWLTMLENGKIGKYIGKTIFSTTKRKDGITFGSIPINDAIAIIKEKHNKKKDNTNIPKIEEKKAPISIIVTAYQTQDFIEECLDSIESQTYFIDNDNYEILVGVDGCEETLAKLKNIRHKYRNLRVFMMDSNMGTYVTSNTLLDIVKYENILRFDSDDIMKPEMIETIVKYFNEYDIIMFRFDNFTNSISKHKKSTMCANGALFFKNKVIELSGGYKNWTISGDIELLERTDGRFRKKEITESLFYRRVHANSLCYNPETGIKSEFRKKINTQIRKYNTDEDIKIKRTTNNHKEIMEFNLKNHFDEIYCINLDRRPDKWESVSKKFDKLNLKVRRFSAVDGDDIPKDILKKYNTINKYAIGCMISHYNVIQDAKLNNHKTILILEDDVFFIEDFIQRFSKMILNLKDGYKILYLGASQHQWNDIEYFNEFYFANHTDGTFAYALSSSIYQDILNTSNVVDKPIDYKLWDIQKKYYKECFVCFPNLIISDVTDSNIRNRRDNKSHGIKMKWNLEKYDG